MGEPVMGGARGSKVEIAELKILYGRFKWCCDRKSGGIFNYVRTKDGKPGRMLYIRMKERLPGSHGFCVKQYREGPDYQHTVKDKQLTMFFSITPDMERGGDYYVFPIIPNLRRGFFPDWDDGRKSKPFRISKIGSWLFRFSCQICRVPMERDECEVLRCGDVFHNKCLMDHINLREMEHRCGDCSRRGIMVKHHICPITCPVCGQLSP